MLNRRDFIRSSIGAGAAISLSQFAHASTGLSGAKLEPTADAMVLIYLPGGLAYQDLWDVKEYTPFRTGMRASELLSTCRSIATNVPRMRLGEGLENLAQVMDKATIVRSVASESQGGCIHLKAQHELITGVLHVEGVNAASIGSTIAMHLGSKSKEVPPYIYIGRDMRGNESERLFINRFISSGSLGEQYAPFMIPDARAALMEGRAPTRPSRDESRNTNEFELSLTLAKNLLVRGARFIQVELPYVPFKGFDMHEFGGQRMIEMKKIIDAPLSQFIRDLHERGLFKRTVVAVMSEFGRTVTGLKENAAITDENMYGFHAHFAEANCALLFGGGFKGGFVHGKTADYHPMRVVENPVSITDVHATIYRALGIPYQHGSVIEPMFA